MDKRHIIIIIIIIMAAKVYKNSIFLLPKFGKMVVVFITWNINNF
jgi:hypothetical protein